MADKEVLFMVRKEKCIGRFSQNLPWRSANERVSGCMVLFTRDLVMAWRKIAVTSMSPKKIPRLRAAHVLNGSVV
jgi:hypothetical protein